MEWIGPALHSSHFSLVALGAAALLGMIMAVGSCCNLPVLAAVVGYAGSRESGDRGGLHSVGFGFFMGTLAALTALGLAVGAGSRLLSAVSGPWGRIISGFIFLLFGVWALDLVPFRFPRIAFRKGTRPSGMWSACLFGFAVGVGGALCSLTCSVPLIPVFAGLASAQGSVLWGVLILLAVSLGYGLTLTLLLLGLSLGRMASFMKRIERGVRLVSGFALLAAGFWLLTKG